jgi:hypothetical protein
MQVLPAAEMAWQQDVDLYSTANYSLVAALELHARIINAGRGEALLQLGRNNANRSPFPPVDRDLLRLLQWCLPPPPNTHIPFAGCRNVLAARQ